MGSFLVTSCFLLLNKEGLEKKYSHGTWRWKTPGGRKISLLYKKLDCDQGHFAKTRLGRRLVNKRKGKKPSAKGKNSQKKKAGKEYLVVTEKMEG